MADRHNHNSYTNQTFLNDESQPPPYSSIYPFNSAQSQSKINEPVSSMPDLFQNSSEPISYEQLFLSNLPSQSQYALNIEPVVIRIESNVQTRLQKQLSLHFQKPYLIKHILFICLSSLTLISFQIVLMNYSAVLSHFASGLWGGFVNLITLLSAVLASKIRILTIKQNLFINKYFFSKVLKTMVVNKYNFGTFLMHNHKLGCSNSD